tara:strand:+ start:4097 stop:4444 length:348 start_codon:yes stop_codon:yes gene_type:complete
MLDVKSPEEIVLKRKKIVRATRWVGVTVALYAIGIVGLIVFGYEPGSVASQTPVNAFLLFVQGVGAQFLALIALAVVLTAVKSASQYLAWWLGLLVVSIVFLIRALDLVLYPLLF